LAAVCTRIVRDTELAVHAQFLFKPQALAISAAIATAASAVTLPEQNLASGLPFMI